MTINSFYSFITDFIFSCDFRVQEALLPFHFFFFTNELHCVKCGLGISWLQITRNIFFLLTLLLFIVQSMGALQQHEIAFRALSLHSVRVDGVSSTSAFHYSFSPSPPPISPVTSNTIVVVLWRRAPLTARKLLDHRGTSSWRQHCAFIPSMQSCTAASTSLAVCFTLDDLGLELEGLCQAPPCA